MAKKQNHYRKHKEKQSNPPLPSYTWNADRDPKKEERKRGSYTNAG